MVTHIKKLKIDIHDYIKNKYWLILSIILLALALRLLGIWHEWPYSYYLDEVSFVKRSLAFGSWDFNPHWFHKPAFFMYLLFFEYGFYFLIGKMLGLWHSVTELAACYIKNPGPFYLIGRSTVVLFSVGTIAIVYKIGERHFKRGAGLMAALLLALSSGHIIASQRVKADIPATFFAILSMLFLLNFLKDKRIKNLLLSAAFAGVGTATKYYPIVMLIPIFLATIVVSKSSPGTLAGKTCKMSFFCIGVLLIFIVSFFVCAPYNFLDSLGLNTFYRSFIKPIWNFISGDKLAREPSNFFTFRMGYFGALIDYIRILISKTGMGVFIGSVTLIGTFALLFRSIKYRFLFLLYPFVFVLIAVFLYPGYSEFRHQTPIYPFLAISGGWFLVNLASQKNIQRKITYGVIILALFHPLYSIVERGLIISRKDTRYLAKEWIEKNIPAGAKILTDEQGPRLLENEESLQKQLEAISKLQNIAKDSPGQYTTHYKTYIEYKMLAAKGSLTFNITEFRFPWWRESFVNEGASHLIDEYDVDMGNPFRLHGVYSYEYYVNNDYEYVIVDASRLKIYEKKEEKYPSFAQFYRELFKQGILVKEFSSSNGNLRPGPPIRIYKIGGT